MEIAIACGSKHRLDIFRCLAVDDSARHTPDRLWPDRCCGDVTVITRSRDAARQLLAEPVERSFDQIGHFFLLSSGSNSTERGAPGRRWEAQDLGTISGKMNRVTLETPASSKSAGSGRPSRSH
jgi:hypothetical protein